MNLHDIPVAVWVILFLAFGGLWVLLKPRHDPAADHSALSQHAKDHIAEQDRRSRREWLADGVSYIESTRPGPGISCPFVLYTGQNASGVCMPSRKAAFTAWSDEQAAEQVRMQKERIYQDAIKQASKPRVRVLDPETPYQPSLLSTIGPEELRMMKRLGMTHREVPQLPEGLPKVKVLPDPANDPLSIRVLGGPREKTIMEKISEGQDFIEAQFIDIDDLPGLPPGRPRLPSAK